MPEVSRNLLRIRSSSWFAVIMSGREPGHGRSPFSEASLKAIVDTLPDMIWVKDAIELRFVLVNKGAEDLLGVSREKLVGKSDHDLFSREQADALVARDREFLAGGSVFDAHDERINTPNGVRTLHVKRFVIMEDGAPRFILGICQDITDRLAREQQQSAVMGDDAKRLEAIGRL